MLVNLQTVHQQRGWQCVHTFQIRFHHLYKSIIFFPECISNFFQWNTAIHFWNPSSYRELGVRFPGNSNAHKVSERNFFWGFLNCVSIFVVSPSKQIWGSNGRPLLEVLSWCQKNHARMCEVLCITKCSARMSSLLYDI